MYLFTFCSTVFIAACRLSVVAVSGLSTTLVVHRLICSTVCGIFPNPGLNSCPLHQQVGSQPLDHQGSSRSQNLWPVCQAGLKALYLWGPTLTSRENISPHTSVASQNLSLKGVSDVVQRLGNCLAMRGTQIWSLVLDDPMYLGATKSVSNSKDPVQPKIIF